MNWSKLLCRLLALVSIAASANAQDPDPAPRQVVLQFELDGSPMPGVPLRRAPTAATWPPQDGWLRLDDRRVAGTAWPVVGRSDPDGRLTLTVSGAFDWRQFAVGSPFELVSSHGHDETMRLVVRRLEQFRVRVLDPDGVPLPRLPMTLQQDGQAVCFACTDGLGFATFGVPPQLAARCRVVPFGWIGPVDDLPTVALQSADKVFDMRLPPFGTVRVRALDRGIPRAMQIDGVSLAGGASIPVADSARWENRTFGAEFGPVALGQAVAGVLRVPAGQLPFAAPPVQRQGELVVVDVECDPWRPKLQLQVVVPGAAPRGLANCTVVTDEGTASTTAVLAENGRVQLDFMVGTLRGSRLRRVDVDVVDATFPAEVGRRPRPQRRAWSGSLTLDRALTNGRHELGVVELAARGAVLRGRVVDERGQGVAGARVDITAVGGARSSYGVMTEADGSFELWQPLLRDDRGAPAQLVAVAALGSGGDVVHSEPGQPAAGGNDVLLVLRRAARGCLQLDFVADATLPIPALDFAFVDGNGVVHGLDASRMQWTRDASTKGVPVVRLGPLPVGKVTLRILLRPGVVLREYADVVIAAEGAVVDDERLHGIDLSALLRTVRMRVLDEEGVPIAGARVEYRRHSDAWSIGPSDGGGWLDLIDGPPGALRRIVSAPGKQPRELDAVVHGGDVTLRMLPDFCVTVRGLPDDLPRAGLAVFLRSVVRENLADHAVAELGPGDTANLPLPPAGRYHVRLVGVMKTRTGSTWSMLLQRDLDVLVTAEGDRCEFVLDAAAVQRVREALAQ
ncbi:MAG: carboxypeptidase regulatory-like domain-containing protein [Planctomycetes bacterium]|nr:carboxypeptidase regulatory-like domain-containing protein [Planctomycetota bacterium]